MSNLGPYQDIVTSAKEAGGVPSLIRIIERKAVTDAAPSIFGKGFGAGSLLTAAVVVAGLKGKQILNQRKADKQIAAEAKTQLATEVNKMLLKEDPSNEPGAAGDFDGPNTSTTAE